MKSYFPFDLSVLFFKLLGQLDVARRGCQDVVSVAPKGQCDGHE